MRQIHKKTVPSWFEKWKSDFREENGRDPHYNDLDSTSRRKLRNVLSGEQGNICCYCMRRINGDVSHIEHFKPRETFPEDDLSYDNMFASCAGQIDEIILSNQHCDQRKNNWYNEKIPKPTEPDFEKCVSYRLNGEVKPYHDKNDMRYSLEKELIEKLGLNAPFLVRNRRTAIAKSEIMDDCEYSEDDWLEFIAYYDSMHDGNYEEYCATFIDIIRRECLG